MKCICGGSLGFDHKRQEKARKEIAIRIAGPIPNHRKKRIQKKLMKRWRDKAKFAAFYSPLLGTSYVCQDCNKTSGMYQAIARNLFPIESMLPAAKVIYFKDEEEK